MPTKTTALTIADLSDKKITKFWDILKNVPLGNSQFQIENFTFNHEAPSRNYRQAALQLRQDVRALVNAQGGRRKQEVAIRRLEKLIADNQKILASDESTEDQKFEAQCVIDESQAEIDVVTFELKDQEVLENDAVERVKVILKIFNKLPSISRDEFEAAESNYWKNRFLKEAQAQLASTQTVNAGLIAAMSEVGIDAKKQFSLPDHMIKEDGRKPKLLES